MRYPPRGLFVTGTDTGVGKTYCAACWSRPCASRSQRGRLQTGCQRLPGLVRSWPEGRRGPAVGGGRASLGLEEVCPQRFELPLAPPLAAQAAGRRVDDELLVPQDWKNGARRQIVVVEGVGGLMSPVSDGLYAADLAAHFGYPLIVVAPNRLGVINKVCNTHRGRHLLRGTCDGRRPPQRNRRPAGGHARESSRQPGGTGHALSGPTAFVRRMAGDVLCRRGRFGSAAPVPTGACTSRFMSAMEGIPRFSATVASISRFIGALHRPSASPCTYQCGCTTTLWWTSSKPPSDWLTVSMGNVQSASPDRRAAERAVPATRRPSRGNLVGQFQPRAEMAEVVACSSKK